MLTVNDGKDVFNNDNSDVDDSIPVWISVEDDTTEPYAVSLRVNNENPTGNNSVTFTATVQSAPVEADLLRYRWGWHDPDGSNAGSEEHNAPNWTTRRETPGAREFHVTVYYFHDGSATGQITSDTVTVTWSEADSGN